MGEFRACKAERQAFSLGTGCITSMERVNHVYALVRAICKKLPTHCPAESVLTDRRRPVYTPNRDWTSRKRQLTVATFMSVLFFKRFLQRPLQVASIIPSSKALVEGGASKMDFSVPRVIAEYGPGEGVHSREIASRLRPGSQLLLFELD